MIDLMPFCADAGDDRGLDIPFTQDGFTYYTDAIVLVRVPAVRGVPLRADLPIWDLAKNFAKAGAAEYKLLAIAEVRTWKEFTEQRIGVAWFDREYVNLLATLPGLHVAHSGEVEFMPFKFDGGMGLLAPLKPQAFKRAA